MWNLSAGSYKQNKPARVAILDSAGMIYVLEPEQICG
jgi:hypothetical protein